MLNEEDRPKPAELLKLYKATAEVFEIIKDEFKVPDTYVLELQDVDSAESALTGTSDIAAMAMRKIQALRWVSKPGVVTANDVVVGLASDLLRALEHLVERCEHTENVDALRQFKNSVLGAARKAGGNGGIAALH